MTLTARYPSFYSITYLPLQPPGAVTCGLRLTEQGEVVSWKYSDPIIGRRNLENLVAGELYANAAS